MRGPLLTPEEHARLAAAIRAAERNTSGEIVCVVTRSSDSYFHAAALMLSIATIAATMAAVLVADAYWIAFRPWQIVAAQALALLAAVAVIVLFPRLRIHLVPRSLRYRNAHRSAVKQFLATDIHTTAARTGVLIFLSAAERYAEILADSAINARVPQERWDAMIADLVSHAAAGRIGDGLEKTIEAAGALLAAEFPREAGDVNELDDRVVEI